MCFYLCVCSPECTHGSLFGDGVVVSFKWAEGHFTNDLEKLEEGLGFNFCKILSVAGKSRAATHKHKLIYL